MHVVSRKSRGLARVSAPQQRIIALQRALTEMALWSTTLRADPQRPYWRVVTFSQLSGFSEMQLRHPPYPPHRLLSLHSPLPCFPRAPYPTSRPLPLFSRGSCTSPPLHQLTLRRGHAARPPHSPTASPSRPCVSARPPTPLPLPTPPPPLLRRAGCLLAPRHLWPLPKSVIHSQGAQCVCASATPAGLSPVRLSAHGLGHAAVPDRGAGWVRLRGETLRGCPADTEQRAGRDEASRGEVAGRSGQVRRLRCEGRRRWADRQVEGMACGESEVEPLRTT